MRITISARHEPLDDSLRDRAESLLNRLGKIGDRALEGTAVFDTVGSKPWAELRLHCSGGKVLVATAQADDHRSALDKVDLKMRRQLRRVNTRPRALRHLSATT